MTTPQHRILLVDDEQAVLDGLRRQHRKHYDIVVACGPEPGLEAVKSNGPFSVVVTDFNMPIMTGSEFLEKVEELDSEIVRVMLTGQADLQTATDAVNRGHIFRFLSKPCAADAFRLAVDAAIEQHALRAMERDLLEQTVRGSIEVLADVLALASPSAFGRAKRVHDLVRHVVTHMRLPNAWQYETAALLSQIGYIAVPDELLERKHSGEEIPPDEIAIIERHAEVARELLVKIPRLQTVAEMIYHQLPVAEPSTDKVVLGGGRILAAALAFDEQLAQGADPRTAFADLKRQVPQYDKRVLLALASVNAHGSTEEARSIRVNSLTVDMVLEQDVRNTTGNLIVTRGHVLTESSLRRLRNHAELEQLEASSLRVRIPRAEDSDGEAAAA